MVESGYRSSERVYAGNKGSSRVSQGQAATPTMSVTIEYLSLENPEPECLFVGVFIVFGRGGAGKTACRVAIFCVSGGFLRHRTCDYFEPRFPDEAAIWRGYYSIMDMG